MSKFLVIDVDGTLTDGKIYIGNKKELFKAFDVKDGYGIKNILPNYGIIPIIITARRSKMLQKRCKEIGVTHIYQGVSAKFERLLTVIAEYNKKMKSHYDLKDCAYIGDDIIDLQCMIPIKEAGGKAGCPKDAVNKVIILADYVSNHGGGNGAVRDFIEWIVEDNV